MINSILSYFGLDSEQDDEDYIIHEQHRRLARPLPNISSNSNINQSEPIIDNTTVYSITSPTIHSVDTTITPHPIISPHPSTISVFSAKHSENKAKLHPPPRRRLLFSCDKRSSHIQPHTQQTHTQPHHCVTCRCDVLRKHTSQHAPPSHRDRDVNGDRKLDNDDDYIVMTRISSNVHVTPLCSIPTPQHQTQSQSQSHTIHHQHAPYPHPDIPNENDIPTTPTQTQKSKLKSIGFNDDIHYISDSKNKCYKHKRKSINKIKHRHCSKAQRKGLSSSTPSSPIFDTSEGVDNDGDGDGDGDRDGDVTTDTTQNVVHVDIILDNLEKQAEQVQTTEQTRTTSQLTNPVTVSITPILIENIELEHKDSLENKEAIYASEYSPCSSDTSDASDTLERSQSPEYHQQPQLQLQTQLHSPLQPPPHSHSLSALHSLTQPPIVQQQQQQPVLEQVYIAKERQVEAALRTETLLEHGLQRFDRNIFTLQEIVATSEGRDKIFKLLQSVAKIGRHHYRTMTNDEKVFGSQLLSFSCLSTSSNPGIVDPTTPSIPTKVDAAYYQKQLTMYETLHLYLKITRTNLKLFNTSIFIRLFIKILRYEEFSYLKILALARLGGLAIYFACNYPIWFQLNQITPNLQVRGWKRLALLGYLISASCSFVIDVQRMWEVGVTLVQTEADANQQARLLNDLQKQIETTKKSIHSQESQESHEEESQRGQKESIKVETTDQTNSTITMKRSLYEYEEMYMLHLQRNNELQTKLYSIKDKLTRMIINFFKDNLDFAGGLDEFFHFGWFSDQAQGFIGIITSTIALVRLWKRKKDDVLLEEAKKQQS